MRRGIILTLGLLLKAQVAMAASIEQQAIDTFDAYCVQNIDDYGNIAELAESAGAVKLPPNMHPATSAMANEDGASYAVRYRDQSFLVGFVNGGNCTLKANGLDREKTTEQLTEYYRAKLLHKMDNSEQSTSFYIITAPGAHQGLVLTLATAVSGAAEQPTAVTILSEDAVANIVAGG